MVIKSQWLRFSVWKYKWDKLRGQVQWTNHRRIHAPLHHRQNAPTHQWTITGDYQSNKIWNIKMYRMLLLGVRSLAKNQKKIFAKIFGEFLNQKKKNFCDSNKKCALVHWCNCAFEYWHMWVTAHHRISDSPTKQNPLSLLYCGNRQRY